MILKIILYIPYTYTYIHTYITPFYINDIATTAKRQSKVPVLPTTGSFGHVPVTCYSGHPV